MSTCFRSRGSDFCPSLGQKLGQTRAKITPMVPRFETHSAENSTATTGLTSRRKRSQLRQNLHGMQGVRSSSLLGSVLKKSQSSTGIWAVHTVRFFNAKTLNITF